MEQLSLIRAIRQFNRFYTNILGLLDRHMPDSEFSLSEARVLYEIGLVERCTSKRLIEELRMDPGYLSRIVKGFEKAGLIYRVQSPEDGRFYYLYLTDKGKETMEKLNHLSDKQVHQMISGLGLESRKRLTEGMESIENILSDKPAEDREIISIRSDLRPGDVGYLIHLHGWIYDKECGYNHVFEGYVCKTFYEFFQNYDQDKDRFWFAEARGEMVGAIAVVGHSSEKAQVRWFILNPGYRGIGLGKKLLNEAIQYSREKGYGHLFLETTDDQRTAIHMYEKAGFYKTAEHENKAWGVDHVEQTYVLNLNE